MMLKLFRIYPFYSQGSNEAMSKKINKTQLEELEKQKQTTLKELENLRADLRAELDHEDVDDAASDLIERDKIQALILAMERRLKDIEHAIEQAQVGGYGICERCGKPIDPERLEIFPEATLCVNCKRETEQLLRRSAG